VRRVISVVSRSSVESYAAAVGARNPLHFEPAAARAAGYRDLVAPPMYAAVYAGTAFRRVLDTVLTPGARARTVHGGQEMRWFELVCAGDEVETIAAPTGPLRPTGRHELLEVRTSSRNQRGELVCLGRWSAVVLTA
jgi:acyl dehydratase